MNKNFEQLKEFWASLDTRNVEGFIQMSDENTLRYVDSELPLPSFDELHNGRNFISEAALFYKTGRSISIRHIGSEFAIVDDNINNYEKENKTTTKYLCKGSDKVAVMYHIWEAKSDPLCDDLPTLEVSKILFGGFKGE